MPDVFGDLRDGSDLLRVWFECIDSGPVRAAVGERLVELLDALLVIEIGFLQVDGLVGVVSGCFFPDQFLADEWRHIEPDDDIGPRQLEHVVFDSLDPFDQVILTFPIDSRALVSEVGRDVTVADDDLVVVECIDEQTARFVAVSGIECGGEFWCDGVERTEVTVEKPADGSSEECFGVSREAEKAGGGVVLVESFDELLCLGPLAGSVDAFDGDQHSHAHDLIPCTPDLSLETAWTLTSRPTSDSSPGSVTGR